MKILLLLLFFFLKCGIIGFSQENIIAGDLSIKFDCNDGRERIVNEEKDFCYFVIQSNLSSATKQVYAKLVWGDTASRFSNYFWVLYKKDGPVYIPIAPPQITDASTFIESDLHMKYGEKGDSIFSIYDIEKKGLLPSKSDTLCFNLLLDNSVFDPGEYRFRIYFRIGNAYSSKNGKREISDLSYVASSWYYFRVAKRMTLLRKIGSEDNCKCKYFE
jgi:hypothetical protein